jgi:hypothetical protein
MRNAVFIAFSALLAIIPSARAQSASPPAPPDGLVCFEKVPAPDYPVAALQAHVDGSVWTWIQVSPQGTPGKIDTQVVSAWTDATRLLTPPVEAAIRAAKIKPACAGKTVRAVFRYQYGGETPPDPKAAPETDDAYLVMIQSEPAKPARR